MEIILGAATIAGGIAALWFFWDKVVALFQTTRSKQMALVVVIGMLVGGAVGAGLWWVWQGRGTDPALVRDAERLRRLADDDNRNQLHLHLQTSAQRAAWVLDAVEPYADL